nr:hypothetical protein [Deltaproteobacteria bacterium]
RPPREINPNIPEAVEKVILKALAKDVDDRYQWCSEMLADLQQYLMSQDVVFTAKTLSSWLKEVFQGEIDKERQLLEQYKRVGRDGLINNVPAAESKADVVENFGEAGAPEGDATQLGGPSFEELEAAVAANAAVGPAPGSPAARGSTPPRSASEGEDDGEFGEEAPTEIFGEIDSNGKPIMPAIAPVAARPSAPTTRPPKPPPLGRAPSSAGNGRQPSASAPPPKGGHSGDDIATPPMDAGRDAFAQNYPNLARPSGPTTPTPYANTPPPQTAQGYPSPANPGTPPQPMNALSAQGSAQGKTLMGAVAPPELAAYQAAYRASQTPGGYPSQAQMPGIGNGNGNGPGMTPQGMPTMNPSGPIPMMNPSQPQMQAHPMNPSHPQMLAHPSGQMPGQNQTGYPSAGNYPQLQQGSGPMQGYGQYNQTAAVAPLEAPAQAEGRKKSSIGRDVAIGVAIAAVVLGGFLAVKFFILDSDDSPSSGSATTSTIATLKIELQPPVEAELFLDGNKSAEHVVKNGDSLPINAGKRTVRIVARDGQVCERELELEAGQTTVVSCQLAATSGSGSGSGSGSAAPAAAAGSGSGSATGSGSAKEPGKGSDATKVDPGKGSDAGSGSAKTADAGKGSAEIVAKTSDKPKPVPVPVEVKPADKPKPVPVEVKPADKPKPVPVEVKPADKPKPKPPDKMPPEDNPADRAGSVQDGYVMVTSKPKAKLSVDGTDTGLSTPTKLKLSPGRHKIGFSYGTTKSAFPVVVKAGETTSFHKDLE